MTHELSPKGDRRRTQIMDAAVKLFGEVGYRSTSLRDIATRVGITHPGLLYHFNSKEDLLLAVLARRDEEDLVRFSMIGLPPATGLGRLLELIAANAERRTIVELFTQLSAEATDPGHPAHDHFTRRYRDVVAGLTHNLEEIGREGHLREGIDPGCAARRLVALMDGLQVQWLYDPSVDMHTVFARALDDLLTVPLADLVLSESARAA